MADESASARTEEATPERLRKARREGQVAQSAELPSAMMLGMLVVVLALTGASLYRGFVAQMRLGLACGGESAGAADFAGRMQMAATDGLAMILPFLLGGAAVSIMASLLASGWAFSPKSAAVKFERISPVKGLKNMFSLRSLVKLVISIAKLVVVSLIVYGYLNDRLDACVKLTWESPPELLAAISQLVLGLLVRVVIALAVIALADVLYQRWQHRRKLRMTVQEVKEERKEHEGSPETRSRIRGIQFEMARKRMLQDVPTADVVITNPTHVAVALRYEQGRMESPVVVAKGGDFLCRKIKEIAREHDVPVIEKPELARALYAAVKIGQPIPETLFVAVAEVLAMIYRLRKGGRNTLPSQQQRDDS